MADDIEKKEDVEEEAKVKTEEEPEDDSGSSKEEIDYEALAKAERERANAEEVKRLEAEALIIKNKKLEKRHKEEDIEDEAEEDKPLTAKDLQPLLARERQNIQKELQESRAWEIARANTATEAEAAATITFWKNRVVPSGNLEEDVRFAIGGLNHKKVVAERSELARALRAKDSVSHDSAGSHRDSPEAGQPKLSAQDASAYKSAGYEWDGKLRLFKKSLNKGKKFVYKDHKSGRSWMA